MDNHYLIKLEGKNPNAELLFAKISQNKVEHIIDYKWYLGKDNYPFTYIEGARVPLHRFIWYINTNNWDNYEIKNIDGILYKKKLYIDHVNRDKLDATDENLRLVTPAENSYNKSSKSALIDPITMKPLHHIKLKKLGYEVKISKDGKINCINKIASLEDAKEIYNMMATELFGKFAVLYQ
jgi:hypothetical protein